MSLAKGIPGSRSTCTKGCRLSTTGLFYIRSLRHEHVTGPDQSSDLLSTFCHPDVDIIVSQGLLTPNLLRLGVHTLHPSPGETAALYFSPADLKSSS